MAHHAELKAALEDVHAALQDPETTVDPELEAELVAVLGDIQRVLGQTGQAPAGLRDQVERQAVDFESRHGVLADALNRIAQTLANMGI